MAAALCPSSGRWEAELLKEALPALELVLQAVRSGQRKVLAQWRELPVPQGLQLEE